MPRTYQRRVGARKYKDYTDESLREAVITMKQKNLSMREASKRFGIPRSSLSNALNGKHCGEIGRSAVFDTEEEESFVAYVVTMSTYGFPLTLFDLRCAAKAYLDRTGRQEKRFKNNFPGYEWAKNFVWRQRKTISQRTAKNINYARAATSEECINAFFDFLGEELVGVPPENIWNYDETCLVDDPGSEKILTKRGSKYPERIRNSSKANTTIMVCGNAKGELAPLYVNYKAEKMWDLWTKNGPPGCRYNRSKSGWFDATVFEDWFVNCILPILRRQVGTKVLVGDNLSSHVQLEVIRQCERYDIKFIALPPNATHLIQPLDVAFFRPMKMSWRVILDDWKTSDEGSKCASIPKDVFPSLLKALLEKLEDGGRAGENLKAGFRKSGIYPIDREQVLKRLPKGVMQEENSDISTLIGESFIEHLEKRRAETVALRTGKRKKRVNITPGKSITEEDLLTEESEPSTSRGRGRGRGRGGGRGRSGKRQRRERTPETSAEEDDSVAADDSESSESFSEFSEGETSTPARNCSSTNPAAPDFDLGQYVLVNYDGELYPGQITAKEDDGYLVSAMEKTGRYWKWPSRADKTVYAPEEIVQTINPPTQTGRRSIFNVPELGVYQSG